MQFTRRNLLQSAAAFGLVGTRSWAQTSVTFTEDGLAGSSLQILSDGKLVLPLDFLVPAGVDQAEIAPLLAEAGVSGASYDSPLNISLLRTGDHLVLFDAGSGPDFMPSAGELPDALDAAGISPEDITDVVFTHAHPDHIWGVLDDFDEPLFTNARHMIGRIEHDYWLDPDTIETIGTARQSFAAGAKRRIETLGDRLELFEDGDTLLPGLRVMMTPGHTPGHSSLVFGDRLVIAGDAVTNTYLGFRRPDLPSGSDQDPEMGAKTRVDLLNYLAESGNLISAYHLPDGGFGRVDPDGSAFNFKPESSS